MWPSLARRFPDKVENGGSNPATSIMIHYNTTIQDDLLEYHANTIQDELGWFHFWLGQETIQLCLSALFGEYENYQRIYRQI